MTEVVYLNGKLMPASEARVSPFDYGFLLGFGLFETMRAYNGHVFRLDRHLARLMRSAEALGIASRLGNFDLAEACYQVLEANGLGDARIRLTISAGEGDIVPNLDTCYGVTVFIVARKLEPLAEAVYERGYRVALSTIRRNSRSPISQHKSTSWLENVLARSAARAAGADDALLLNERGMVAECSASNIFVVHNGVLRTPTTESGALPGVTREVVLELAEAMGLGCVITDIELGELLRADEAFVTSSIIEVMPLTQVDGRNIGDGNPGPMTKRLMAAYRELVKRESGARGGG
jgi:branched-chain amino acid aminotransferase group I